MAYKPQFVCAVTELNSFVEPALLLTIAQLSSNIFEVFHCYNFKAIMIWKNRIVGRQF